MQNAAHCNVADGITVTCVCVFILLPAHGTTSTGCLFSNPTLKERTEEKRDSGNAVAIAGCGRGWSKWNTVWGINGNGVNTIKNNHVNKFLNLKKVI